MTDAEIGFRQQRQLSERSFREEHVVGFIKVVNEPDSTNSIIYPSRSDHGLRCSCTGGACLLNDVRKWGNV
jgi:hypothetical protein